MTLPKCRFCEHPLEESFCNLGKTPFSNSYLQKNDLQKGEVFYPLHAYVCSACHLVQLEEFQKPDQIFSDYAYFSSYSSTWLNHAKEYVNYMVEKYSYDSSKYVVEIASNDGYLLQYFKEKDVPVLGVEPAANVAKKAEEKGIPTLVRFFGVETAEQLVASGKKADLLIGNNVLAHVPDINDFVKGMKILLSPKGIITMEFSHLLKLIEENQFDTIYHEHFSYLSLLAVERIFGQHGLRIFDVHQLPTHGGSLRIFACHQEDSTKLNQPAVASLKKLELESGLNNLDYYRAFENKVRKVKHELINKLVELKKEGKTIVGYGAPAKGNTLLNYCGVKTDFLDYTVDLSPHKQGLFLPGTHIPIYSPEKIKESKPDFILILPWNLKKEIMNQMKFVSDWNAQWIVPVPYLEIISSRGC